MTPERQQHHRDMLALAQGFMPHNPLEACQWVEAVLAELRRAPEEDADARELRGLAEIMLARYREAAEAWQAENARRSAAMRARELEVLRRVNARR